MSISSPPIDHPSTFSQSKTQTSNQPDATRPLKQRIRFDTSEEARSSPSRRYTAKYLQDLAHAIATGGLKPRVSLDSFVRDPEPPDSSDTSTGDDLFSGPSTNLDEMRPPVLISEGHTRFGRLANAATSAANNLSPEGCPFSGGQQSTSLAERSRVSNGLFGSAQLFSAPLESLPHSQVPAPDPICQSNDLLSNQPLSFPINRQLRTPSLPPHLERLRFGVHTPPHQRFRGVAARYHIKVTLAIIDRKATEKFEFFPQLPTELQLHIWSFCRPKARVLTIKAVDAEQARVDYREHYGFGDMYDPNVYVPGPVSPLLHICQQSREYALKHWYQHTRSALSGSLQNGVSYFVDTEQDAFYLDSERCGDDSTPPFSVGYDDILDLIHGRILSLVKCLVLRHRYPNPPRFSRFLYSYYFPSLKQMIILMPGHESLGATMNLEDLCPYSKHTFNWQNGRSLRRICDEDVISNNNGGSPKVFSLWGYTWSADKKIDPPEVVAPTVSMKSLKQSKRNEDNRKTVKFAENDEVVG